MLGAYSRGDPAQPKSQCSIPSLIHLASCIYSDRNVNWSASERLLLQTLWSRSCFLHSWPFFIVSIIFVKHFSHTNPVPTPCFTFSSLLAMTSAYLMLKCVEAQRIYPSACGCAWRVKTRAKKTRGEIQMATENILLQPYEPFHLPTPAHVRIAVWYGILAPASQFSTFLKGYMLARSALVRSRPARRRAPEKMGGLNSKYIHPCRSYSVPLVP